MGVSLSGKGKGFIKNPVTQKRIARFKEQRLALVSLWVLLALYLLSLGAELFCNSNPLYVRHEGKSYFPVFQFYSEDTFLHNGKKTRPDYKKINGLSEFKDNASNFMIFPFLKYGPFESVDPELLAKDSTVDLVLSPVVHMGTVNINTDYTIRRSASMGFFLGVLDNEVRGLQLSDYLDVPKELNESVFRRFENKPSGAFEYKTKTQTGVPVILSLTAYSKRSKPPKTVRLRLREEKRGVAMEGKVVFNSDMSLKTAGPDLWDKITVQEKKALISLVEKRFSRPIDPYRFEIENQLYRASFEKEDVRFPFRPVKGHVLGIDGAGRDVLARILYGLRISLSFGLLLVVCSMLLGVSAGAVQGYFGGLTDISAQRFIEIWSALPFLYIMILMGSIYGRSFLLLLFCYGIFNWIGISYYVRAEFLRLRKQAFVESAKCMGLSSYKIIFKHIMPNAMVPVITFFPFSLVGAIGSLAALDYLGFGLPPPTPSWGELIFQAQTYRWAWWLVLYPALALFIVMLLGVFIGEGIRNAYDPKRYSRLE